MFSRLGTWGPAPMLWFVVLCVLCGVSACACVRACVRVCVCCVICVTLVCEGGGGDSFLSFLITYMSLAGMLYTLICIYIYMYNYIYSCI